jgi:hypothetical protein
LKRELDVNTDCDEEIYGFIINKTREIKEITDESKKSKKYKDLVLLLSLGDFLSERDLRLFAVWCAKRVNNIFLLRFNLCATEDFERFKNCPIRDVAYKNTVFSNGIALALNIATRQAYGLACDEEIKYARRLSSKSSWELDPTKKYSEPAFWTLLDEAKLAAVQTFESVMFFQYFSEHYVFLKIKEVFKHYNESEESFDWNF